jgi:hypothetical protein
MVCVSWPVCENVMVCVCDRGDCVCVCVCVCGEGHDAAPLKIHHLHLVHVVGRLLKATFKEEGMPLTG